MAEDKPVYNPGNNVVLTAFVLKGSTPATGATVRAFVIPPTSLNANSTLGSFQLTNQTTANGFTQYTYRASLTNNSGAAFAFATAKLINIPSSVSLVDAGILGFANLPTTGSTISVNTFAVQAPSSQTFDPATLSWDITAPGTPATVTLSDSGQQFDFAAGDGLYTGVYVPSAPGVYQVLVSVSGTLGGAPFARTAHTKFKVVNQLATLSSITDAAVLNNGLIDHLVLSAQLNVQTAGNYALSVALQASNGRVTTASGLAALTPGSGHIDLNLPASQILGLGVDGPYEKVRAAVVQMPAAGDPVNIGYVADAGPTAAYTLASFSRGPLYFTGQNSAAGVITGAGPTFDLLRVQVGIYSATSGVCAWSADLTDAAGNLITSAQANGTVTSGNNSVALSFDGIRIAQAGSGPYAVRNASIVCGANQASAATLFTIPGFTASQFTYVAPSFILSLVGPAPSAGPGSSSVFHLQLSSAGSFADDVVFSFAGLPAGAAGIFAIPSIVGSGLTDATVAASTTLAPGNYPFAIGYSSGSVSKTLPLTLTIVPVTVTVAPATASLNAGQTQQFTAPVANATTPAVTWSLSPNVGAISAAGLYTAPSIIGSAQTVTVTATSVADGTKSATASIALNAGPGVSVGPAVATLFANQTQQFTATVLNTTNTAVTWSLNPNVGTISSSGLYTAPSSIASAQTITVIATSTVDNTRSASATVTLGVSVTVTVTGNKKLRPDCERYGTVQRNRDQHRQHRCDLVAKPKCG